ncbi:hypothetical protein CRM73_19050, partial [Kocuria sp. CCUG 69068]|nr:hypothetical protein [Kocuria sp. CCUG 69068]
METGRPVVVGRMKETDHEFEDGRARRPRHRRPAGRPGDRPLVARGRAPRGPRGAHRGDAVDRLRRGPARRRPRG